MLTSDGANVIRIDENGGIVLAIGEWNDPTIIEQLGSAISAIHVTSNNTIQYSDKCDECIEKDKKGQYYGCHNHRGNIQLWRKGDPRSTELYRNAKKQSMKDGSDYQSSGDSPITPWELMTIRSAKVHTGHIADLQFYVMVLMGTKFFFARILYLI